MISFWHLPTLLDNVTKYPGFFFLRRPLALQCIAHAVFNFKISQNWHRHVQPTWPHWGQASSAQAWRWDRRYNKWKCLNFEDNFEFWIYLFTSKTLKRLISNSSGDPDQAMWNTTLIRNVIFSALYQILTMNSAKSMTPSSFPSKTSNTTSSNPSLVSLSGIA